MKTFISDPFQVRDLEKKIKRKLTEMERCGELPVRIIDVNGRVKHEWVKRYNMRDFFSK